MKIIFLIVTILVSGVFANNTNVVIKTIFWEEALKALLLVVAMLLLLTLYSRGFGEKPKDEVEAREEVIETKK